MSLTEIERDVIGWNSTIATLGEGGLNNLYLITLGLDKVSCHEGGESAVTLTEIHPYAMGFLLSFGYVTIDRYNSEETVKSTLCLTRKGGNIMSAYHCPKGLKVRLICE